MRKRKNLSLEKTVMSKIDKGEITMRPRWYFVLGSIFLFAGLLVSTISAIFFFNLALFLTRTHYGPMYQFRLNLMIANFPWWILPSAILGICAGIYFLKKYEFSYKRNFVLIAFAYMAVIFTSVFLVDYFNLDKFWIGSGPMRRFYQNAPPGRGNGQNRLFQKMAN